MLQVSDSMCSSQLCELNTKTNQDLLILLLFYFFCFSDEVYCYLLLQDIYRFYSFKFLPEIPL